MIPYDGAWKLMVYAAPGVPEKVPRPLPQLPCTVWPLVKNTGVVEIGTSMKNVVPLGKTPEAANDHDGAVAGREKEEPKKRRGITRLVSKFSVRRN